MRIRTQPNAGLTLVEGLVLLVVLAALAVLLLAGLSRGFTRSKRISCTSNLKQVGLAARLYANDHGGQFPWKVPMASTGTLEFAESPQVFRHFAVMSNELVTPRILVCSSDNERKAASNFPTLKNKNLSYFVGLDAQEAEPLLLLSGDRNVVGGTVSNAFKRILTDTAAWNNELHNQAGNLGLADGSVQQMTSFGLQRHLSRLTNGTIRLAIP